MAFHDVPGTLARPMPVASTGPTPEYFVRFLLASPSSLELERANGGMCMYICICVCHIAYYYSAVLTHILPIIHRWKELPSLELDEDRVPRWRAVWVCICVYEGVHYVTQR